MFGGIRCKCVQTSNQLNQQMTYDSRIPVSQKTRQLVKAQKRGGETYNELLRQMTKQYDPDQAKD